MTFALPIHTATVGDKPLRFFRAPSGRVELAWHSTNDLFVACAFPPGLRERFRRGLQEAGSAAIVTVATPAGPVVIAPNFAAEALFQAMLEANAHLADADRMPEKIVAEYVVGALDALEAMSGDLPFFARCEYELLAVQNSAFSHDGSAE